MAAKLHMSVAQMRQGISQDEFLRWAIYWARVAQRDELASKMGG